MNETENRQILELLDEECRVYPCIKADIQVLAEAYDGVYTVTPQTTAQILQTKNKQLVENITIETIPVREIANNGGLALIIG